MKKLPTTDRFYPAALKKTGDSSYLNVLRTPGKDLCELSRKKAQFANDLIGRLLENSQLETSFIAHQDAITPLQNLFLEAYDQSSQDKYQEIGIGFPIFYQTTDQPERPFLLAPLFIWKVNFRPDYADKWHFQIDPLEVVPNHLLLDHIQQKYQMNFTKRFTEAIKPGVHLNKTIYQLCYDLIVQLGLTDNRSTTSILPCPQEEVCPQGMVSWSGGLNLFGVQQLKQLQWAREVSDLSLPNPTMLNMLHPFGSLPVDPAQELVTRQYALSHLIVDGDSGTGKAHTITNVITNALSNKKRVLVIGDDNGYLQSITDQLATLQLNHLTLDLFTQINKKETLEVSEKMAFDKENFTVQLNKCLRNEKELGKQYQAVQLPIFGPHNWTNLVGLFLEANEKESNALLNSQLKATNFNLKYNTFNRIANKIKLGEPFFKRIGTTTHPLNELHPSFFLDHAETESEKLIQQKIDHFKRQTTKIQESFIEKLHHYSDQLGQHYSTSIRKFSEKSEDISEQIADLKSLYGDQILEGGRLQAGKLKLLGLVSKKSKNLLQNQVKIRTDFAELRNDFQHRPLFDFAFPTTTSNEKIQTITDSLIQFKITLTDFQQQIPILIQQNLENLSSTEQAIDFLKPVQQAQNQLTQFIDQLNDSPLFDQTIALTVNTLQQQQSFVESIDNQLNILKTNLRDFSDYYHWQRFWLQLDASQQSVLLALIKTKPNNWLVAFESWYYHQVLTHHANEHIPQDDKYFTRFSTALRALKPLLSAQIAHQWNKQKKRSPKLNLSLFQNVNLDFSANDFALKSTVRIHDIVDQKPVCLVTPDLAMEWIPTDRSPFDIVLLIGAEQLVLVDYFPLLHLGSKITAFVNTNQSKSVEDYTIHDYLMDQGVPEIALTYHHRPGAKIISHLYRNSFEASAENHFFNKTKNVQALQKLMVDTSYRTPAKIKIAMAEQLEFLLDQLQPGQDYRYPNIDMVVEDKELLKFLFYRLYQKRNGQTALGEKLRLLFPDGIQIFSPTSNSSTASECLIYIQSPKPADFSLKNYQRHLSTVKDKLFIVYPKSHLSQNGHSNLLDQHREIIGQSPIQLSVRRPKNNVRLDNFLVQTVQYLSNHITPDRIKTHVWINELYIPFLVTSRHSRSAPIAIIIDGKVDQITTLRGDAWEADYRNRLTFNGVEMINTWSIDWWKAPRLAAEKLNKAIEEKESQYVG